MPECTKVVISNNRKSTALLLLLLYFWQDSYYKDPDSPRQKEILHQNILEEAYLFIKIILSLHNYFQYRIQNPRRTTIVVLTENITHMGSCFTDVRTSNNFLVIDTSIVLELVSCSPASNLNPFWNTLYNTWPIHI